MLNNEEHSTVEEQYSQACTSSNLKCDTRDGAPMGSTGLLIASGWSTARIGGALSRLHSEYTSTSRPPNASETDHRLLMMQLKTLQVVLQQITIKATQMGIEHPAAVSMAVVANWLDDVCKSCNKLGRERIPGTPMLSNRLCKPCKGSGKPLLPYGDAGRRVEEFILYCRQCWLSQTSRALYEKRK